MNEGTKSVNVRDYYNNGYEKGFQKGKLEQKKEDNNILIKYSKLRLYRSKSCQLLIKQLQKEIGGMKDRL